MKTITIQVPDDCEVQIVRKEEKKEPVIKTYQDLIDNSSTTISEKVTKSMLAMAMISQLMPYYGGEITKEEWENEDEKKYIIIRRNNKIEFITYYSVYNFLAFHTEEQRDEFLKYNEQLVKDYLMI